MSWLDKLESFWSSFFERPFRRGEAGIQPVEIAKHLARTMHANRTISISRVYVPNIFLVYLSLRDWERLSSFLRALAAEMEDFLRERATEQGYTLVGDPKVEFEIDDNLKPGEISIHCRLEEKAPAEEISGNTLTYVPLDKKDKVSNEAEASWELAVLSGPDKGRNFLLRPGRQVIGRNPACEFVLTDPQVSRRHCLVEVKGDQAILIDLGSRNQTVLNDEQVGRALLKPGDKIRIGETVLEVRVV